MLQQQKKSTRSRTVIQYKKRKPIFFYTRMITQDTRTIMVHEFFNTIGLSTITLIPLFFRGVYHVKI